jgi:branched-chain amino acid transport system substrate-binding protein
MKTFDDCSLTRRDFLKVAGAAAATVGAAGTLGAGLAACGTDNTVTTATTAGATTTTGAVTTSTAAAPETTTTAAVTTTAGAEAGREVKVGIVAPITGTLAAFGGSTHWAIDRWNEALAGGVVAGDGKNHPVKVVLMDTQSDSNRAGQVTGDLITNEKVDVVFSYGSPDTVLPSADQCEAAGVPSLSAFLPWQAFVFNRNGAPDKPFKWTYALALGLDQIVGGYVDMFGKIATNKKVGLLFPNNADGMAWSDEKTGAPPMMKAAGYELVMPGLYPPGAEDYTTQIAAFKKAGCEICCGALPTPDFTSFWRQSLQQGFRPKVMTAGLALGFPESAVAVGPSVVGVTSELGWSPSWTFKSSLTGQTCQELCDDYEKRTGHQWAAVLGAYALMEWYVDALKRAKDVDDKEACIAAIGSTKMEGSYGLIDFTVAPQPGTIHPTANCYEPPTAGGQWRKGAKWPYDIIQVSNKFAPGTETQDSVKPLAYES